MKQYLNVKMKLLIAFWLRLNINKYKLVINNLGVTLVSCKLIKSIYHSILKDAY